MPSGGVCRQPHLEAVFLFPDLLLVLHNIATIYLLLTDLGVPILLWEYRLAGAARAVAIWL